MEDKIIRYLNGEEELRKAIPIFKEAFIKYYGEDIREEIDKKFSKVLFIGYQKPESIRRGLTKLEELKSKELIKRIIEEESVSIPEEEITGNYSFEYRNLQPIYKYWKLYNSFLLQEKGRKERFIEEGYQAIKRVVKEMTFQEYLEMFQTKKIKEKYANLPYWVKNNLLYYLEEENITKEYKREYKEAEEFLRKIIPNITIDNFEEYIHSHELESLNRICERYQEALEEYEEYKKKFHFFYEEVEFFETLKQELSEKYFQEFVQENMDLIPEDKRDSKEMIRAFFGYSLQSDIIFESFTEEKEKELKDPNTPEWIKQQIMESRIKFFHKNGIYLGNNYKDYEENEEARKIWPNENQINRLLESKEKYLNRYNNDLYTKTKSYQSLRKEVDSKNYLDKNDSINARLYTKGGTFITPNIIKTETGYDLRAMAIVNFDDYGDETKDHFIVHELNHIFELALMGTLGNTYEVVTGWDHVVEEMNQEERETVDTLSESDKRPYELLNEIINELIAQEISELMHKSSMYIFDDEKHSRIKNVTSYEHSLFLVRDFYQEFKEKIILSRRNGNINIIWDEVGKENFDELNSLFSIYFENFSGFKIYNLLAALNNQEDNEQTRVYYELVDRKNEILEKMREHKEKRTENGKAK